MRPNGQQQLEAGHGTGQNAPLAPRETHFDATELRIVLAGRFRELVVGDCALGGHRADGGAAASAEIEGGLSVLDVALSVVGLQSVEKHR